MKKITSLLSIHGGKNCYQKDLFVYGFAAGALTQLNQNNTFGTIACTLAAVTAAHTDNTVYLKGQNYLVSGATDMFNYVFSAKNDTAV